MYAGFELFEHVAVRPGSEEYLDSEKYQIRVRDWDGAVAEGRSLAPYLTRLNEIRREHPALQRLRNVVIHSSDDENILVFSKQARSPGRRPDDIVIVVINLDPHAARETMVHLDLPALGLDWSDSFTVHDEITGDGLGVGPAQLRPARPVRRAGPRAQRQTSPEVSNGMTPLNAEPDWFKTAVFYEVLVRSFRDSNADGTGDFNGLTEKLDYLEWLGVDCLWVPPFFTSPAARRRVRRRRLHRHPPRVRHRRGLPALRRPRRTSAASG